MLASGARLSPSIRVQGGPLPSDAAQPGPLATD